MNIDVGYKLLMVEDSTIDRRVYNRLLANTSLIFTLIVEAPSIADAVEAMKADDFDVVLVDYCLPDGNGLEFTQRLNVDMLSRPLAIIALTSHHEQKLAVEWMKGGAHDFLVKEKISPKALEHALRQAMEKAYLQHEVSFMATHDSLTQAVNRRCLVDRLQLAINSHARDGACFSVIYIDIDRFKFINDNYGHSVGDEMLVTMVERVKSVVRVNDTIGRLGGDEFLLIIENTNTINIEYILQKILISMEETPVIDGQEIPFTISLGVAAFPSAGHTPSVLISAADQALFEVKRSGRAGYLHFNEALYQRFRRQICIDRMLAVAIKKGELSIVAQPILCAQSLAIRRFEMLTRWESKILGSISPSEFIPRLKNLSLQGQFTQWLLDATLAQFAQLYAVDSDLKVAINFSVQALLNTNFIELLSEKLTTNKIPASAVELEIIETDLMENFEVMITQLHLLRDMGVSIAIDDFGAGYSSFRYLADLPIDTVKIDQKFLIDVPENQRHCEVIDGIMALCHRLKLSVVTEGVETEGQLEFMRTHETQLIQGFFIGEPHPLSYYLHVITVASSTGGISSSSMA